MPELAFRVEGAEVVTHAAAPLLAFKLRVDNATDETIHAVALRCQIQIDTRRRRYGAAEQARLKDLFGEPERWGQTLRSMLWTHASVVVPPFRDTTVADLQVPCTYDFNVAAAKYFYGLEDGDVPLSLLFSGTAFYATEEGALQVAPIPWDREASFSLPIRVWQQMMEHYYPNTAWLSLRRDIFDRLYDYKIRRGLPTWEQVLEGLLDAAAEEARP